MMLGMGGTIPKNWPMEILASSMEELGSRRGGKSTRPADIGKIFHV